MLDTAIHPMRWVRLTGLCVFVFIYSSLAEAQPNMGIVTDDLRKLSQAFRKEFTPENVIEIVSPSDLRIEVSPIPGSALVLPASPLHYVGYFLSPDTIQHIGHALLRQSDHQRHPFFSSLISQLYTSKRETVLYQLVNADISENKPEERFLSRHLLRNWVYFLLMSGQSDSLEELLGSDSANQVELKPQAGEFYRQHLQQAVFEDLLSAWKHVHALPAGNAKESISNQVVRGMFNFKNHFLGGRSFPYSEDGAELYLFYLVHLELRKTSDSDLPYKKKVRRRQKGISLKRSRSLDLPRKILPARSTRAKIQTVDNSKESVQVLDHVVPPSVVASPQSPSKASPSGVYWEPELDLPTLDLDSYFPELEVWFNSDELAPF